MAAAFLVLTFLAEAEAEVGGGTVCRVGVDSLRVEGGLEGATEAAVAGVGVCWRPERRDTSCSDVDMVVVVVAEDPAAAAAAVTIVEAAAKVVGVDVAEGLAAVTSEAAEAGAPTTALDIEVVFVLLNESIAVGDVELLRDVLPFRALKMEKKSVKLLHIHYM